MRFDYEVFFTEGLFEKGNPLLVNLLRQDGAAAPRKVFFVVDSGVAEAHPFLLKDITAYTTLHSRNIALAAEPFVVPGGEMAKNKPRLVQDLLQAVSDHGICRHSYLIAIGGGALLDLAGYAAAVAHRGIRHIRIPTTVLLQNELCEKANKKSIFCIAHLTFPNGKSLPQEFVGNGNKGELTILAPFF